MVNPLSNVITVQQVSKRYGKKLILSDVDMTVSEGEIYGLIGPSGAGKTTLVKLIVGMDSASQGKIEVGGISIPNLGMLQRIGYMAQSDALYPELTGEENLEFFASLFGLSKKKRSERIDYAADLVKLSPHLSQKVMAYSGGMKRRLSLAIALVHDPQVLVLDEPTVGIDPELRLSIWNELYRLKEEGKSILVTTHVMDEAEKCDRLAMMREGRLLTQGSPAELKRRFGIQSLEEIFIKAGGMDA